MISSFISNQLHTNILIIYYSQIESNEWNYLYVPIPDGFNASGVIDGVGDQIIVIPGEF